MIARETVAKSVLSRSQVYDYAVNPYVGCGHGCRYCYAAFMRRFTEHRERWGEFVDVKINAHDLLAKAFRRKPMGRTWLSGVCDPYQVDFILIDKMNDSYANRIYAANGLGWAMEELFFIRQAEGLKQGFDRLGIPVRLLF